MSRDHFLIRTLCSPPLAGIRALQFGIIALTVPTLLRSLVQGTVLGNEFLLYMPFVLASALFLRCSHAAAVALAASLVTDFLFVEPYFQFVASPSALFGVGVFLVSSALVIGVARALRGCVEATRSLAHPDFSNRVIFSEEGGHVWVTWYSAKPRVHLGPQAEVADMMRDFLAQAELGRRLLAKNANPGDCGGS